MKLLYTPIDNYVHTVEAVINYAGLRDRVECVPTRPYGEERDLLDVNPLGKVPCLAFGDHNYLAGGPVVYEYLDSLHEREPLFPVGETRWDCLRRAWLADGHFDTLVTLIVESWLPRGEQRPDYIERQMAKLDAVMVRVVADARQLPGADIGAFRTIGALEFMQLKWADVQAALGLEPQPFDWRAEHRGLGDAYGELAQASWFQEPLM